MGRTYEGCSNQLLDDAYVLSKVWDLIVVLPSYKEPNILHTIQCLQQSADVCSKNVLLIIVVNAGESADAETKEANRTTVAQISDYCRHHTSQCLCIRVIESLQMPLKKAGVGLARKIGMDEAYALYMAAGNPDGVIVNLDADCLVSDNYVQALVEFFDAQRACEGCSIHFEHPLESAGAHLSAIIAYELHLRYYINIQQWVGLPYAYQTIGSAMAVRAGVYAKVGGMNTRKAGEDFYFLQKVIQRGRFACCKTCTVYPSARVSDRVPFGTGRAIMEFQAQGRYAQTYHPEIFIRLKRILEMIIAAFKERHCVQSQEINDDWWTAFSDAFGWDALLAEIHSNTAQPETAIKRFYSKFDAFMLMKWCHFVRDHFQSDMKTEEAARQLLSMIGRNEDIETMSAKDLLLLFRSLDRSL